MNILPPKITLHPHQINIYNLFSLLVCNMNCKLSINLPLSFLVAKQKYHFIQFLDLKTMTERLRSKYYVSRRLFIADMMRIFTNCKIYNAPETLYYEYAVTLQHYFQTKMKELGLWDKQLRNVAIYCFFLYLRKKNVYSVYGLNK